MYITKLMKLPTILLCTAVILHNVWGISPSLEKRSDDPSPLETLLMQHSSILEELNAEVAALNTKLETKDRHVAFLAQFSSSHVNSPASGPYQFDKVIFNDGNGYDPTIGIFTAPVSGVYVFTAQFFTYLGQSQRPLLDLKVNGNTYVRMAFDAETNVQARGEDSDSTSCTVKLQAGDRVWAASTENKAYNWWGSYHTFFSGALLYSL